MRNHAKTMVATDFVGDHSWFPGVYVLVGMEIGSRRIGWKKRVREKSTMFLRGTVAMR